MPKPYPNEFHNVMSAARDCVFFRPGLVSAAGQRHNQRVTAYEQFWPWRLRQRHQPTVDDGSTPTAQEQYRIMINGVISPALRSLGLKGSGGRYELPSVTHWALLDFQKSV